jgi:lipid II:glycine glycyltransferase (peptidoglycan interpeptide bridge formation enzyme)
VTQFRSTEEWDDFLADHPNAHLLQTAAWGELKASFGWRVARLASRGAGAQILFRRLPFGPSLAYIPKGPLGRWLPDLLPDIEEACRQHGAFVLKVEPDDEGRSKWVEDLSEYGFQPSKHAIQPRQTIVVDLEAAEDEILARMHKKTRYNIRLAARKEVLVRPWTDIDGFGQMMEVTGERDSFGVHSTDYYRRAYELFSPRGECELFVAEYRGRPLGAVMVFAHGERAWYLYGASNNLERNRMPNYLLQWEAMRWARSKGCTSYDMWGIPDADPETLESEFPSRSNGLWGVYRFKRGFGGRPVHSTGIWDRPFSAVLHGIYRFLTSILRNS